MFDLPAGALANPGNYLYFCAVKGFVREREPFPPFFMAYDRTAR